MDNAHTLSIRASVAQLRSDPRATAVFGSIGHHFVLSPPLEVSEVAAFESRHSVSLPEDYRWFLSSVANGGAGPYYGVLPLGHMDGIGGKVEPWSEDDGFIGTLSQPFPLSQAWNDLTGMPDDALADSDEAQYEALMDAFDSRYWSTQLVNGAVPVCHLGCALRIWLVLTGPERGTLWRDNRAEYGGLLPLPSASGPRTSFLQWYDSWLQESLATVSAASVPPQTTSKGRRSFWSRIFGGGA